MIDPAFRQAFHAGTKAGGGKVAGYIPALATADPALYGAAVLVMGGETLEAGDARAPFTIQSISKALTYAWALTELDPEVVTRRVGVEPSGDAFNSIILEPDTGRPHNPMVNAGAIALTALLAERGIFRTPEDFLGLLGRILGREAEFDAGVYASERETGHRNRAIAHLMLSHGVIKADVETVLDLYFWQCSALVTAVDLARIGAVLAGGGREPEGTGSVFSEAAVQRTLSVMFLCGMYDFSGEWTCRTGLPAKSGVSGGVLAVAPGRLGLGVYSPPLDPRGNSVRGLAFCEEFSRLLNLHALR